MTRIAALLILMAALGVRSAAAQATPPPIQGVTGTIATEGSRDGVKKAAGAAARGVKKILPGGGAVDAKDPLETLIEGSHVVVREAAAMDMKTEGVVVDVNKKKQQITIRRQEDADAPRARGQQRRRGKRRPRLRVTRRPGRREDRLRIHARSLTDAGWIPRNTRREPKRHETHEQDRRSVAV
jgi:hypothetical protein